ncbi:DUF1963 domain-containing protein [Plantactinospora sp. BB1]|uniref:DUF1963 domain-containing protein n=1 Tax=Plantactinospora sp. BB1 TaxID=2071627 RepID=UPI00131EEB70|nr:DUF1963 domain-containing protein [Plantactinospora sp. BB1]
MDYYGRLRHEAMERGIPVAQVSKLADHLRFAIWVGAGSDWDGDVVGQSGGLPRLPAGAEWPSNGENPLPFVASLDCAALPKIEKLPLPVDGSLLFFLDHEGAFDAMCSGHDEEYARVLYVPAGTETVPPPSSGRDIPDPDPERRLCAKVEPQFPNWLEPDDEEVDPLEGASEIARQLASELTHADELIALTYELWPAETRGGELCVGGYTWTIGGSESPEMQMARERLGVRLKTGPDLPRSDRWHWLEEEEFRLTQEWVPLVQFATESDLHYGRFFISFADLAAGRFDKMRSFPGFTE